MPHRIAKQIYNEIKQADKILIVPHQNPDGDAMGSVSAMAHMLQQLEKDYALFCSTEVSAKLTGLPHLVRIPLNYKVWEDAEYQLIIVLDTGDLEYAGIKTQIDNLQYSPVIVNIDHHASNKFFGHHNLVMTRASSTAEILYQFFKYNNIDITQNMALSLLTGLITDTENFSNPGTTEASLKIASDLIHRGANFNMIKSWFLKDKPVSALKLWGLALSRLTKHEQHDIVYTEITRKDIEAHQAEENEAEGIANFLNNINEGSAVLVLKETSDNRVKGSMRTTRDDVDVSKIAAALGGGGHKKASGFTLSNGLEQTKQKIWETLEKTSYKM